MLETAILGLCALNLVLMAAWLTTGVLDNLLHPFLNETYTAQVLDMERLRGDYPEAYAFVAYRRISSSKLRGRLFRAIVVWEIVATLALWASAIIFGLAFLGGASEATAIACGLFATGLFISVWAGFLIAGNYFCYWFGHEGGQNTHFQMLHWGMACAVLLVVAAVAVA
ncbi:DUF2165 family protein [Marimonas sp. MJW-29]|uniref:DUF2165 family protein n=1 Tax=Sulfitobacter sediminis TaxID=3234186 RepID=A0ABV3RKK3_9RHOB